MLEYFELVVVFVGKFDDWLVMVFGVFEGILIVVMLLYLEGCFDC